MTDQEQRQHWSRDDERWRWAFGLGVSVLLVVLVQAAAGIWWAASLTERVGALENGKAVLAAQIKAASDRNDEQDRAMSAVITAAGRIEERLDGALRTLERIERQLYNGRGAP